MPDRTGMVYGRRGVSPAERQKQMSEPDNTPGKETVATGADTLVGVLRQAAENGFSTQMIAESDGTVECESCRVRSPAAAVKAVRIHRLEGSSDAADLMLVVETRCPQCGSGGVLILGYGPNAGPEDEAVLADLDLGNH